MSLIIAGERSGVGKTTITLALLSSLQQRSRSVQSFKVGPDYIDPMFHTAITQRSCRNLDPVLTSEQYVQRCFARHSDTVDYALIEGVMGLFDGAGSSDFASTAHIARLLKLPILLVVDCSHLSRSVAAIVHGYRSFDPELVIAGLILNRVGSDRHAQVLTEALIPLGIPIVGILHRQDQIQIPDRHLGLVPAQELSDLQTLFEKLAYLAESCFDWSILLPLLKTHPQERAIGQKLPNLVPAPKQDSLRIAIAQDAAFNFYYADNLDLLKDLGAELIPWYPLANEPLPAGIQGVYLGGGFPEVFAAQLSDSQLSRRSLQAAIQSGLPTYAECGGLMYLCEAITDLNGVNHPMVGILPTIAQMRSRLTLGYRAATALRQTVFLQSGETVRGHEFHHSQLTAAPEDPVYGMSTLDQGQLHNEGWAIQNVHASYLHLHWGETPQFAATFLKNCQHFSRDIWVSEQIV
jgi:cobyrinic acid a,c-diamide synthase